MNDGEIEVAANLLWNATACREAVAPLREGFPGMTASDAYAVQDYNTERRLKGGARLVGRKIGLTARAVQRQLGVDQPDFGMLFADMAFADGEPVPWSKLLQPKVETEVALVMDRDLPGRRGAFVAE